MDTECAVANTLVQHCANAGNYHHDNDDSIMIKI